MQWQWFRKPFHPVFQADNLDLIICFFIRSRHLIHIIFLKKISIYNYFSIVSRKIYSQYFPAQPWQCSGTSTCATPPWPSSGAQCPDPGCSWPWSSSGPWPPWCRGCWTGTTPSRPQVSRDIPVTSVWHQCDIMMWSNIQYWWQWQGITM